MPVSTTGADAPKSALQSAQSECLAYEPPQLRKLGDLRALTLGGSIGRGDSGAPTRQARPGRI